MSAKLETLSQNLQKHFGDKLKSLTLALGEVTIEVGAADYLGVIFVSKKSLTCVALITRPTVTEAGKGADTLRSRICFRFPTTGVCVCASLPRMMNFRQWIP